MRRVLRTRAPTSARNCVVFCAGVRQHLRRGFRWGALFCAAVSWENAACALICAGPCAFICADERGAGTGCGRETPGGLQRWCCPQPRCRCPLLRRSLCITACQTPCCAEQDTPALGRAVVVPGGAQNSTHARSVPIHAQNSAHVSPTAGVHRTWPGGILRRTAHTRQAEGAQNSAHGTPPPVARPDAARGPTGRVRAEAAYAAPTADRVGSGFRRR